MVPVAELARIPAVQLFVERADAQAGFAFDVQVERPGSGGFTNFAVGRRSASAGFMPDAGPGTYLFRSRLRSVATGKASAWSPATSLRAG